MRFVRSFWDLNFGTSNGIIRNKLKIDIIVEILVLDVHRGMNTNSWFWGFCMVCK